jgi:photosystem II stability/assembly factor-like uncharacterized protein
MRNDRTMNTGMGSRTLRCAFIALAFFLFFVSAADDGRAVTYFEDYLANCGTNEVRCIWFSGTNVGMLMIFKLRDYIVLSARFVYNHAVQTYETRKLSDAQILSLRKIAQQMPPSDKAVESSQAVSVSIWREGGVDVFHYDRQHAPTVIQRLYDIGGGYYSAGNPIPAHSHPQSGPAFQSIHMSDSQNGWAQEASAICKSNRWEFGSNAILRTTNGGLSWKCVLDASPKEKLTPFFYDLETAWVADVFDDATNMTLFRTRDGGRSWLRSELHQGYHIIDACLCFLDKGVGWLMLIPDHGMNSSPGDLYRTDDSGAHWQRVNSTTRNPKSSDNYAEANLNRRQPYLLFGGSIAFRDVSTGWLCGSMTSTTPGFLSATRDGGRAWRVQSLPLPSSLQEGSIEPIGLPRFFGRKGKEGILVTEFCPADNASAGLATVIYSTRDGGSHWGPTTPVRFLGVCDFVTTGKGWMWSAEPRSTGSTAPVKGTLYRTEAGGNSWVPLEAKKGLEEYLIHGESIVQLDFVDDRHGWAIARDACNLTQLLQSTDGGQMWNIVPTKVEQ